MIRDMVIKSLYELMLPESADEKRAYAELVIRELDALQARAEKAEANFAKAIGILEELKVNFSEDGEYSFCKSGKGHPMTIIDALHIGNITEKADALIDEWKKEQENE